MLIEELKESLKELRKFIESHDKTDQDFYDFETSERLDTIYKIENLLRIAPESYREVSYEDEQDHYFTAECPKCNWWGSSKLLDGGGQIADTGDYDDSFCPVCGSVDIDERPQNSKVTKNQIIEALDSFPDLLDGRISEKDLREAADDWWWETGHVLLHKLKDENKSNI